MSTFAVIFIYKILAFMVEEHSLKGDPKTKPQVMDDKIKSIKHDEMKFEFTLLIIKSKMKLMTANPPTKLVVIK